MQMIALNKLSFEAFFKEFSWFYLRFAPNGSPGGGITFQSYEDSVNRRSYAQKVMILAWANAHYSHFLNLDGVTTISFMKLTNRGYRIAVGHNNKVVIVKDFLHTDPQSGLDWEGRCPIFEFDLDGENVRRNSPPPVVVQAAPTAPVVPLPDFISQAFSVLTSTKSFFRGMTQ